jgi:AraC family ethanolamine operon transcriptional activator
LRYAFEDLAGISPAAYLKAHQLSRVHSALLETDPSETLVKTIAYEHRFWHLGQFSRDYRLAFGERPSETLARSAHHGTWSMFDSVLGI